MHCKQTVLVALMIVSAAACGKKQPPALVASTAPPPETTSTATTGAPSRVETPLPVPPAPALTEEAIGGRSLDDLNRNSPLRPVLFLLDSAELDDAGRAIATANADILRKNPAWVVTIEGHCDERGSAEYNLALGERRAGAVKAFLVSLGIAQNRVRTVSYGKEFPFDPGHTEEAWAKSRRGHFVITSN
jgi:peptidoglycan-associated lipoprotein